MNGLGRCRLGRSNEAPLRPFQRTKTVGPTAIDRACPLQTPLAPFRPSSKRALVTSRQLSKLAQHDSNLVIEFVAHMRSTIQNLSSKSCCA